MIEGVDYKIDIRVWDDTMYVARCLSCDYRTGRYEYPRGP